MPSFDIVSQVDRQEVRNAVEQANKEITNRFDFKGSDARVEQTELLLTVYADDEFKLNQVMDVLRARLAKRNVDVRCLEPGGVELLQLLLQAGFDLLGPLRGRARRAAPELIAAAAQPRADQLFGHLDVALHAEMPAERISLVLAVRVLQHPRRAGRDAESLAMPVERFERLQLAQPVARHRVVGDAHLAPADLPDGAGAHRAAEGLRHQLPAEAMADRRDVLAHGVADQLQHRRYPGQRVVDAHRPAHQREARESRSVARHPLPGVERAQLAWN